MADHLNRRARRGVLRVSALISALLCIGIAAFLAPWIVIPILGGILFWVIVWIGKRRSKASKELLQKVQYVAVCIAVVAVIYLIVKAPGKPKHTSVDSRVNRVVATNLFGRFDGDSRPRKSDTSTEADSDRITLRYLLQIERQNVKLISRALSLYQVASAEYQAQVAAGNPDANLDAALNRFEAAFEKELTDANESKISLLAPEQLASYLKKAEEAIDELEKEDLARANDSQKLRQCAEGIPYALSRFRLHELSRIVANLQDSLKQSLRVQLSPDPPSYTVKYILKDDLLISEESTTIHLSNNPASQVDLTGFFTSRESGLAKDLYEDVQVKEDAFETQTIQANNPVYRLRPGVNDLTISKRVTRTNASEKPIDSPLPLRFLRVRVDWPVRPPRALTLELQQRGNPGATWPFMLSIEDKTNDASLSRIVMPPDSVYFVDPPAEIRTTPTQDEVIPRAGDAKLRQLLPGSQRTISIELLPRYLNNVAGRWIKDYLSRENLAAALIFWLVTSGIIWAFKSSWGDASPKN